MSNRPTARAYALAAIAALLARDYDLIDAVRSAKDFVSRDRAVATFRAWLAATESFRNCQQKQLKTPWRDIH